MKGGYSKMNTRISLWVIIGVLFITALFLTFKAGGAGSVETVQAVSNAASSGGMVGGC